MREQFEVIAGSIDSHAHLSMFSDRSLEADTVLRQLESEAMGGVIDVGIRPTDLAERVGRFGDSPIVSFTAGLHPTSVDREWRQAIDDLARRVHEHRDRVVAIGELGLDFHHSTEHAAAQREALFAQIAIASEHELPIVVHNRESEEEMLAVLGESRPRGVMHCFSQDLEYCRRCLEMGMMISFGGNLTYRRSESIREAARFVPDDMLLVETDAPFLSPQAVRGLPNHPGHLFLTIEALADMRGTSPDAIAATTASNAMRLFGLDA